MKLLWIVRGHVTQCIGRSQATQEIEAPIEIISPGETPGCDADLTRANRRKGCNETYPGSTDTSLIIRKPDCFAGAVRNAGSRQRNRNCAVMRRTIRRPNRVSAASMSPCTTTTALWWLGFPYRRHTSGVRMHGFHCSRRLGSSCRYASVSGPPACEFCRFAASFHPPLYLRPSDILCSAI